MSTSSLESSTLLHSDTRIENYFSHLRQEFKLLSSHDTSATKKPKYSRFEIYLNGLQAEFGLMTLEIESLKEERDQLLRERVDCPSLEDDNSQSMSSEPSGEDDDTNEDEDDGSEDEARLDWSIAFNDDVQKTIDIEIAHVLSHENAIFCVRFNHDGKYLAAACADGSAYVYQVDTGKLTTVLKTNSKDPGISTALCFSHDGKYFSMAQGTDILTWKIGTKYGRSVFELGPDSIVHSIDFSPNDRLLVSTSNDIRIWNVRDGNARELTDKNPVHLDQPHYRSAIFSPNGKYVAASHRDGMVRIWHVASGLMLRRIYGHMNWVNDIAFIPDGTGLVCGSRDNTLKYWDINSLDASRIRTNSRNTKDIEEYVTSRLRQDRTWPMDSREEASVLCVAVMPDCRWVITGTDENLYVWDPRGNRTLQCSFTIEHEQLNSVAVSSSYLAAGGNSGKVRIWRYTNYRGAQYNLK